MEKSLIITLGLGIPGAISASLVIIDYLSILPIAEALSKEIIMPHGILLLIIGISFGVGIGLLKLILRKNSTYPSNWTYERSTILNHLEQKYGNGFNLDDACVFEAFQKGREDVDEIAVFTNMKESKVQKIVNKLADKEVPGFEYL